MSNSHLPMRASNKSSVLCLSLVLFISILLAARVRADRSMVMQGNGQADGEVGRLETGRAVERELSGGQSHFYEIGMTAGQYLHLVVDQRGIDVVVALFAPNGERRIEVDTPNGAQGPEILSAVTDVAGTYRIEVRALEKSAQPGRYEIKIDELRMGTAEDRDRLAAEANFHEALQLENGDLESKRKSLEKLQRALELYRRAGHRAGETATLRKMARIYYSIGEMRESLEKYNELLPLRRAAGDRAGESETISDIGMVRNSLGDVRESLEFYHQALLIDREISDRRGEAATLNNIGEAYRMLGEMQKALENFNESLVIERTLGKYKNEAIALNNIGHLYSLLGEKQKALEYFNEAMPIFRTAGDRIDEAVVLNNIGQLHSELGETQKALESFNQSLAIARAVGGRVSEAFILTNIGHATYSLGEKRKALEYYQNALAIFRLTGDRISEGSVVCLIGQTYQSLGEGEKALENFNIALRISRETGDRSGESIALLQIARAEQNRGELTRACEYIEQAIAIVESLRNRITSEDLRASYLATHPNFYGAYIDILMQMHRQNPAAGRDAAALAVSERARARSLLELLAEARADIRHGADSSLIERERSLQQNLAAKTTKQISLLASQHTPEQAEAIAQEIAGISREYEEVEAKIRETSPRYAALTQPQPLNLSEIQKQVLDPDTLLLEYWLGNDASYLFVVSDTSITSYQLPKRAEIEAATRLVRELLTAPEPRPGDSWLSIQVRTASARKKYPPAAVALSRMLLGPAASQLGTKRLLVVADGALQYLPFGTLPLPETQISGNVESGPQWNREMGRQKSVSSPHTVAPLSGPAYPTPLMVIHEIIQLPSASTLEILRRELAERKPAPKMVAILADPVFSPDDSRVKSAATRRAQDGTLAYSDLTRAVTDVRGELKRLLMTREEAQAISSIAPPDEQLEALDFRASRALCTSDTLSRYRIVHFATHGLLDSEHPYLSGLVLSLVNERGQPEDGFLRLPEIFNLRLRAELVVLSACQTGLGKEVRGEGLVGLTRGFMYAGAARVVASLWKVDDAATAELMKRFYQGMMRERMRPAAALRAAQIEMWKKPQWQIPFYWGAFVLQGEWK